VQTSYIIPEHHVLSICAFRPAANRLIKFKEVGANLVANLGLLERFSRSAQDFTSWWEWLEEELMSPNSTLLPTIDKKDTQLFAKWGRIKAGYLDYYNTVHCISTEYSSH